MFASSRRTARADLGAMNNRPQGGCAVNAASRNFSLEYWFRQRPRAFTGGAASFRRLSALAASAATQLAIASTFMFGGCAASAQTAPFKPKSITMLIGYGAGGGTDLVGRVIAASLGKYLPGNPSIIVQNMPGAEGTLAGNYFAQQVAPDGLTLTMSAATQADPLYFRRPQARFKPYEFEVIGGVERGGTALIVDKNALARLRDPSAKPVIMGSLGGVPRAGMQAAAWGRQVLGWNLTWVVGYPSTAELLAALERGEIEMTSTAIAGQLQRFLSSGKIVILSQSGSLEGHHFAAQPSFGGAPILYDLLETKLTDPLVKESFDYWADINSMDEWMALPPKTPTNIVDAYRKAYDQVTHDPDFLAQIGKIGQGLRFRPHQEVEGLLNALSNVRQPAIDYIGAMLRSQNLKVN
jgi:tripartite-type tricarboxylate transporter receptor subunit TctC